MRAEFLADTNILINLLEGDQRLIPYSGKLLAVSFVSEIELLGKPGITASQLEPCKALLHDCLILSFNDGIKEIAIDLRQKKKIRLADVLIAATGLRYNLPILTFDTEFSKIPGIELVLLK